MVDLDQASDIVFILGVVLGLWGLLGLYNVLKDIKEYMREIKVMLKIRL